jgi:NADPH-dependent F420 reductase
VSRSPVPIVGGTGALGFGLALRFASAGVPVVIGSRDAGRAEESARKLRERVTGAEVEGLTNDEAATKGDIVLLCVPFRNQSENLTNLKNVLREGQILVDATVPLAAAVGGRATRLLGVPQGSAGQQAQEMAPEGVQVVSALHTVPIAGDKKDAKRAVAELIAQIPGLRPIDCGRLEMARVIEGLTPLLIAVNGRHKTHAGIKFVGLEEAKW